MSTLNLALSKERSKSLRETELTEVTGRLALKTVSAKIRRMSPRSNSRAVTNKQIVFLLLLLLRLGGFGWVDLSSNLVVFSTSIEIDGWSKAR